MADRSGFMRSVHWHKLTLLLNANCLPRIFLLFYDVNSLATVRLVHTLITSPLARQLQPEAHLLKLCSGSNI